MVYLVRISPLLYLYYIFLLQLQEDHEAPANPKTDSLQFFSGSRNMTNIWVELVYFFFILLLIVEKFEIILNKHKEWHWFFVQFIFV